MTTFKHTTQNLLNSNSGAIAPIFALSLIVLVGITGLAVDSARGYGVRNQLQNALDAAALATARQLSIKEDVDVDETFNTFFNASASGALNVEIKSVNVTKRDNAVEAKVTARMSSMFMGALGVDNMNIAAHSIAEFGLGDAEVVLALDNTGSMAGAKLDTLKTAARELIDALDRSIPSPERLRVGVVPFSKYVNVGMANRNANWMDVPLDTTTTTNACWDTYPNAVTSNCRNVTSACTIDGIPQSCTYQQCDVDYGAPVQQCGPSTTTTRWYGCAGSRDYPLNVKDQSYSTRIPGVMNESCAAELTPLTTDRTVARNSIDAMVATGDTYIPEGVMWGWRLLSPSEPFPESQSAGNPRVQRFLVVMTDGINSVSPSGGGSHNSSDSALANTYTEEACDNAKKDKITIFTVAFEVNDATVKNVLKKCASSTGNFFDASDSTELLASFDTIAQQMVSLRIKQ